jgi:HAD superfamily hydrolase (TIGR01509 family)
MRAVLFDLDGTLLDLDVSAFLGRYYRLLEQAALDLAPAATTASADFMRCVTLAVDEMMGAHPGVTNRDVFYASMLRNTGIDLHAHWDVFDRFYREVFPTLNKTASPVPGARQAVQTARELGLKVAVATNPIFPLVAIEQRIAWAGLDDVPFDAVTAYEDMCACKPHPAYFIQTAELLGVAPEECVMVGDDANLDMAAAQTGMVTYYVGNERDVACGFRGDLTGLAGLLPSLAAVATRSGDG